jgi:hypothetical protein
MNSARLLLDIVLAAAALAAPLFTTAPAVGVSTSMTRFFAPAKATRLKSRRLLARKPQLVVRSPTYTVTATAYQAVPGQTDDEPFVTADNSRIKPHYGSKKRWMALSRDLLKPWGGKFNFGDKVRVRGISPELDGVYTIHDTMNRRHRHCMDILTHVSEKFDIFQKGVKIQKVEEQPAFAKL